MVKTVYDVNAIAFDTRGKMTRLAVEHPMFTLKECDRQIEMWQHDYDYKLIVSWVQVKYEGGSTKVVHFTEYDWRKYISDKQN